MHSFPEFAKELTADHRVGNGRELLMSNDFFPFFALLWIEYARDAAGSFGHQTTQDYVVELFVLLAKWIGRGMAKTTLVGPSNYRP